MPDLHNIKLVAIDLDQTLLRSDKTLSTYSLDILARCRKQGILAAIATARSEMTAMSYMDLIKPDAMISNGGALVRIGDETIYKCMMSAEVSDRLIKDCLSNLYVGEITAQTEDNYFRNSKMDLAPDYSHAVFNDFSKPLHEQTYKITVEIFNEQAAAALEVKYSELKMLCYTGENWYRFSHKNAGKGDALKALCKHLKIPLDKTAVFGDDYNDIDMLEAGGFAVAVDNAIGEAKAAADYIASSNDEDGVAKFIEDNILI